MRRRLKSRRCALAPVFLALASVFAPSAAVGHTELIGTLALPTPADVALPTPIDAYQGRVVWSEPSPTGYRLVEYHNGTARQLPVAPSAAPFDVDLGPDRRGHIVAVYPRCARALDYSNLGALRGCDLYRYDLTRPGEIPLRSANTEKNEGYPAIWKGRLAFTRGDRFYWRWLSGVGRSRPLGKRPALSPSDVDLRGSLAALAFEDGFDGGRLDLVRIGSRTRHLGWATSGVSIGRRFVHWLALWGDRYNGYYQMLTRYDRRTNSEERAYVPSLRAAWAFARDGTTSYYMTRLDPECASCAWVVYRTTDLPL